MESHELGYVRVGTAVGCTMVPFLDAFADFSKAHPQVRVSLTEGPSDELLDWVASGELDLALTGFLDDPPDELAATVLFDEPVVAVLPLDHRLARLRMANLLPDQLVDETLMCLPPGTGVRAAWDRTALHAGVDPRPAVEASSAQALEQLVRRGTGIAILSPSMVTDPDLAVRQINGAANARFGLVARSGPLPPASAALLVSLTAALGHATTEPLGSTTHPPADV